ncbi:MAG: twin-arginine translocase subunit TatC [Bdellovibrionaceae bacterium]|nr:twin-arginine translocase subunit TatC [Pseudobdellovibrionaceae bacterium]
MSNFLEGNDSLMGHLTELRKRLLIIIFIIFIGFIVCWIFSSFIFDVIRAPILPYLPEGGLIFTAPMDKFLAHIKVSLIASIVVTCPVWIFQVWLFVAPGLYAKEKKMGLGFMFSGTFLFLTGVSFVYFVVYPMAFKFLMSFGGETDKPMITISSYLSFFTTTTLVFGLAFEMPLILTILGMMGLISSNFLIEKRRYAIVILAFLSAVFTPPDVISMLLMMAPMLLLYEISIFMVKIFGQKQNVEIQ